MSKQLSHREILTVLRDAIEGNEALDTQDKAFELVSDLAELVASHLGYTVTGVAPPMERPSTDPARQKVRTFEQCWAIGFVPNECTPSDGGLLAAYDTDITNKEWWEQGGLDPMAAVEPPRGRAAEADWIDAFNSVVDHQCWGPDSERSVLLEFIGDSGIGEALPDFAARVAAVENSGTNLPT